MLSSRALQGLEVPVLRRYGVDVDCSGHDGRGSLETIDLGFVGAAGVLGVELQS